MQSLKFAKKAEKGTKCSLNHEKGTKCSLNHENGTIRAFFHYIIIKMVEASDSVGFQLPLRVLRVLHFM